MAREVNENMVTELTDLVEKRRKLCKLGLAAKVKKLF
jgi:hypothetical protein